MQRAVVGGSGFILPCGAHSPGARGPRLLPHSRGVPRSYVLSTSLTAVSRSHNYNLLWAASFCAGPPVVRLVMVKSPAPPCTDAEWSDNPLVKATSDPAVRRLHPCFRSSVVLVGFLRVCACALAGFGAGDAVQTACLRERPESKT